MFLQSHLQKMQAPTQRTRGTTKASCFAVGSLPSSRFRLCSRGSNFLRAGRGFLNTFQNRIGDRTDMRINAFQIAKNIQMQRCGLERFWAALP